MNSFDFFDTLATRRVARPTGVFELVERLLPWPGFAALRAHAEAAARKRHSPREVTLADIYAQLPEDPRRAAARDEELRLERALLAPIPGNLRRLQPGDIVVCDTVHAAEHLRDALRGFGVKPLPVVHVSSEAGIAKHDGALWDRLLTQGSKPLWHIGEHRPGDVAQPQQRGIQIYPYRGAVLSRWEQAWAEQGLAGAAVAGCARAARLAHHRVDEPPQETALCDILGAAVAPALLAFVDHVLDSCLARGIGRALFLARHGQLLHRLAEQRVRTRRLKLEVVYAHGSPQALGDAASRQAARAYFTALGLAGTEPVALVDLGFDGQRQAALRSLIEAGGAPLHGFSFCLAAPVPPGAGDSLEGFAFDPARDHGENRLDGQRAMLVTLLEADEGPTIAFEQRRKGKALPVFGPPPTAAELRWVRLQQGAVLAFAHEWAQFEAATQRSVLIERAPALNMLLQMLYRPNRDDALAFAGRCREVEAGTQPQPLVTQLSAGAGLARRDSWGLWPEGSLAMLGAAPLSPLLRLVRRLRR